MIPTTQLFVELLVIGFGVTAWLLLFVAAALGWQPPQGLPFCHFDIRAARRKPAHYPKQIKSLDNHIRMRRPDLKLLQRQVADQIGVDEMTISGSEGNATVPEVRFMSATIEFLGYNPFPAASSLPGRLATARKVLGLSQRKVAEKMGFNSAKLVGWEAGQHQPTGRAWR